MESQLQPHRVQQHEHDPQNLGLLHQSEEDGQHHEKKSVLKKVKEKAKKIKDTITKHGHGHDQDYDHDHDHEEEDDELVEDPELHGAPMYESAAMRSGMAGQIENQNVGLGRSTAITHDQSSSAPKEIVAKPIENPSRRGQDEQSKVNLGGPMSMEVDPSAPKEDDAPRNYEIKTIDLAGRGSKEVGDSKIIDSFGKMKVNDEPQTNQNKKTSNLSSSGSHEQDVETIPENQPAGDESSYTQKMLAAVASKFGYGEKHPNEPTGEETKSALSSPLEYGKKIAATMTEKLSPVQEKGVGVKEYWKEKLKPGEEDKALSEMISGALHKKPKGKVEESEEVKKRLGTGSQDEDETETEKGVESWLKDTVGSWLGKTRDSQTSKQSRGSSQSQGVEGFKDSSSVGEEATQRQDPGSTQAEVRIL